MDLNYIEEKLITSSCESPQRGRDPKGQVCTAGPGAVPGLEWLRQLSVTVTKAREVRTWLASPACALFLPHLLPGHGQAARFHTFRWVRLTVGCPCSEMSVGNRTRASGIREMAGIGKFGLQSHQALASSMVQLVLPAFL